MTLVVPRRGPGYVQTTPTPTIHGNIEPVQPVDIGPAARHVAAIVEEHQQKADEVALLDADNQLAALSTNLEVQALQTRGKDALAVGPHVQEQWTQATSDIENGLTNDRQKENFRIRSSHHWQALNETVSKHGEQEYQKYDAANTDAALENRRNDAVKHYPDPLMVGQALAESKDLVELYGQRNSWSSEQIKEKRSDAVSKIHSGVIDQMLIGGNDLTASQYYAKHQDELTASDSVQVQKALELGSVRGESQRRSDAITTQTATLGGALAEARKIADPRIRDATEDNIRRVFLDRVANDRQPRDDAFQRAGVVLEQTGNVRKIPPADWFLLSVEDRAALQRREDRMLKRDPNGGVAPNSDSYVSLLNMAGLSDASRAQFESVDLSKYRGKVTDQEFKQLLSLQLGERRQTETGISSEERRRAAATEKDAKKVADRAAAVETLRSLGVDIPVVPGSPLRKPAAPAGALKASPKGRQVPQAWLDQAARNPDYKLYLQHMGVIFDSTPTAIHSSSTGDIQLK